MNKLKLIFYVKKEKTDGNGNAAIYGKIAIADTNATFASGKYINPGRWVETNHLRNVLKKEDEKVIQAYLKFIEQKADSIYLDLLKNETERISADTIKSSLFGESSISKKSSKTILNAIDFHNTYFEKLVQKGEKAQGTLDRYICVKKILQEFMQKLYGCDDMELYKMDKYFVNRFDAYLRTEKIYKKNVGCCNNTTVKYIRNLKTIFNHIVKQGEWLEINPFAVYNSSLKPVNTTFLEEAELKAIEEKRFSCDRLNTVKDIFLFSCYTSFAPIDAMHLTWSNVIDYKDGQKWIMAKRIKTDIEANLPILPPVKRIIEKYKNDPRCANEERLLPKISNQKMNAYLKEIADICSISKKLTWYVSRHTFATTVTLNNNIPLEVVSKMMGHTNTKQTQHYAKIQKNFISKHMAELATKFS